MKIRTHGWLAALVALALAGGTACNREPDTARDRAPEAGAGTDTAENSDARISTSVQARFYSDEQVRGRHIDVHSENAVVTLRGTVDTEQARQRAVELARGVDGVQRVQDELEVTPAVATSGREGAERRTDVGAADRDRADEARRDTDRPNAGWITTKIQAQYFVTPGVAPWNVDVNTSANGVVTLEGEVDSAENRQRAVQIARETEGVARVEDRLRVRGDRDARNEGTAARGPDAGDRTADTWERPDVWITTKVQSKYFLDDDVRGRNIDVTTNEGVVVLRGHVRNDREKRQAVALARNTDGVRDVRDELTIQPAAEGDGRTPADARSRQQSDADRRDARTAAGADRDRADGRSAGSQVDDGWVTTKVQSQLYLERDVRGRNINVETRDGVVTLRGETDSDAARQLAERIARETEGVRRVDNQIKVAPQGQNR